MSEPLTAPYVLEYTYQRTTGPIVGRFLGALSEQCILGAKTPSGRVIVPAVEWDPISGESTTEMVELPPTGTVVGYTWVASPRRAHPRSEPFAFVLVKLDGADTAILHVGDFPSRESIRMGARVRARFASERSGAITDIRGFEPIEEGVA